MQPHGLQASLSFTISQSLLKLMSIESVHPTISSSFAPFSSCPQSFLVSGFFHELALHTRWSKYWSLSFSISPSNEYSGLISFRLDWFDLALQETLKRVQEGASLLWHHNLKESILWRSAFFIVQFSHPYITSGKTINRFSCVQLCNPMDCSPPGSSVHGILQARILALRGDCKANRSALGGAIRKARKDCYSHPHFILNGLPSSC